MHRLRVLSTNVILRLCKNRWNTGSAPYMEHRGFGMWDLQHDEGVHRLIERAGCPLESTVQLVVVRGHEKDVHVHRGTDVVVTILNGVFSARPVPPDARVFIGGRWRRPGPGEVIEVPRNTPHDVHCEGRDALWFLAVQDAAIAHDGGVDYHSVPLG